jgi:glycosyltransferase involved in cell wall biosynthesis
MSLSAVPPARSLLLYEPRVEGHHPTWLRFIAEDLLAGGYDLTLAVDLRPAARTTLEDHLGSLGSAVKRVPALDAQGRRRGGNTVRSLALCLEESGAVRAFLCALDELASSSFRRAAVGVLPPAGLHGRIGGIYHRPRFTAAPVWSPNRWLKRAGFRRLVNQGWFRQVVFLDEYLVRELQADQPNAPFFFLPGPCPQHDPGDPVEARRALGVPLDRRVFLCFGVGGRRKGLHLAVQALRELEDAGAFLLCAGRQQLDPPTRAGLESLTHQGRAFLIDRYVSPVEERQCFDACDVVLLPYVNHFGTSAVLFRAAAAGRMVIASDEQLLGRLVRDHELGLRFRSGDTHSLAASLRQALALTAGDSERWIARARAFAQQYSRAAYRQALLAAMSAPSSPASRSVISRSGATS